MTPELRAEKLLEGVYSVDLKVTWNHIPHGSMWPSVTVSGYVELLREQIAAAIREAVAEEREHCARVAVRRSCTWSAEDDKRSQDFREGIEVAACQLATIYRSTP